MILFLRDDFLIHLIEIFHPKQLKIITLFGLAAMGLLIKILFLSEKPDSAWNSPCESTRIQWWIIFPAFLSITLLSMVLPMFEAETEGIKIDIYIDAIAKMMLIKTLD